MPGEPNADREQRIGSAPGRLEHVRAFVNTLDVEAGTDELDSPAALTRWLRSRDLIEPGYARATADDLQRAIAMREALRHVLLGNAGQNMLAGGVSELRAAAAGLTAQLQVGDEGGIRAVPGGQDAAAGLAALLLIAAEADATGTWARLKVCRADDCRWAFYDRSPTKSGCWCSMAVCGSRAKSRTFRQRAATRR